MPPYPVAKPGDVDSQRYFWSICKVRRNHTTDDPVSCTRSTRLLGKCLQKPLLSATGIITGTRMPEESFCEGMPLDGANRGVP